jgi:hypothetical protein
MSEKNNNCEKNRKAKKKKAQFFIIPKHQSQKKRDAGVPGKEKVISSKDAIKNFFIKKH